MRQKRSRPVARIRPLLIVEQLECRLTPSTGTSYTVALDPSIDQFGDQIPTVQSYGDGSQPTFGIFDTGASAITFSADDQAAFATPIPIKATGAASGAGVGGGVTGDVSQPGTILADGLHTLSLTFDANGNPVISFNLGAGAAAAQGVQAFIGTTTGSPDLTTITGTPILSPSSANPTGLAALIDMHGTTFDLSSLLPGFNLTMPDIHFVAPGVAPTVTPGATTDPFYISLGTYGGSNASTEGNLVTEAPSPVVDDVTLLDNANAVTNQNFLLDTGSQITILSPAEALQLGLDLDHPETVLTIDGVGGQVNVPGYTLSELDLPTTAGGTIRFTNVPIYVMNVAPGLNGLLGMNLFNTAASLTYDPYFSHDPNNPTAGTLGITFSTDASHVTGALDSDQTAALQGWGSSLVGALAGNAVPELQTTPDTTPPTGSASFSGAVGANDWYDTAGVETLIFTDTGAGVASLTYSIDGGAVQNYTDPFALVQDGTHSIVATATDYSGNIDTQTFTVQIDATAPTLSASFDGTLGSNGWYTTAGLESLTAGDGASGVASVTYSLDGGAAQSYTGPFAITQDGLHTLIATVTDTAGNVTTHAYNLPIDTTAPTLSGAFSGTAGASTWYRSNGQESLDFSDGGSGVASATYRLDGQSAVNYGAPFSISGDGAHTVSATVTDMAGNIVTQTFTINIDTVAPVVTLNTAIVPVKVDEPTFSGTRGILAGDSPSVILNIYQGSTTAGPLAQSLTVTGSSVIYSGTASTLPDGNYIVQAQQTDLAGNVSFSLPRAFVVHTTTFVTISAATNLISTANETKAGISGLAASGDLVTLTITDGVHTLSEGNRVATGGVWNFTGLNVSSLNKGSISYIVKAADAAGFIAYASTTAQIDITAPTVSASFSGTLGTNGWYTTTGQETLVGSDSGSGVGSITYKLDGGAAQSYTGPIALSQNGAHNLIAVITDAVGNATTKSYTIQIDTTAPTVSGSFSGIAGAASWYRSNGLETLKLADNAAGVASATYRLDGKPAVAYRTPFSVVGDGTHTIVATVLDKAGNVATQTFTFQIDTVAPVLGLNPVVNPIKVNQPSFAGTRGIANGDSATVVLKIYKGTSTAGALVQTLSVVATGASYSATAATLADGTYVVQAAQTDLAGHIKLSLVRAFVVHTTTAVAISAATPLVNATNQTKAAIIGTATAGDLVYLSITDGVHTINAGVKVAAGGKWAFTGLNLSSLNKGTITYTVKAIDSAGFVAFANTIATKS